MSGGPPQQIQASRYSIAITANDSITKKFLVLKDGPLKVAHFWHTQFDELAQLKNFDTVNKFTNVLLLLSGDAKDKWINALSFLLALELMFAFNQLRRNNMTFANNDDPFNSSTGNEIINNNYGSWWNVTHLPSSHRD